VVEITVIVEVLHGDAIDPNVVHAITGDKVLVDRGSAAQVAQFGPDHGFAATWLVMLELDDLVEIAVQRKGRALAKLMDTYHCQNSYVD
jgi:hypothetical protein